MELVSFRSPLQLSASHLVEVSLTPRFARRSAEERLLTPFTDTLKKYFKSHGDWFRAFAILLCLPIAGFYACLSFLTQSVRRSGINGVEGVPKCPKEVRVKREE